MTLMNSTFARSGGTKKQSTGKPASKPWRPGNGLAVLVPGTGSVRVGNVSPAQQARALRQEVKAGVRSLRLQPAALDRPLATVQITPSAEEKLTLELATLEGGIGCARLHALNPSPLELERVGQQLRSMLGSVHGNLIVDVADVGSLHCAVINWLLDLRQSCTRFGGHMMLTGLSTQAHDVLISTGLARKLHFADSVPEAHATLLDVQRRLAA